MTRNELLVINKRGEFDTIVFDRQPTTNDMAVGKADGERYVAQLIGGQIEVYDLRTLRRYFNGSNYTIGLPVFVHEDLDAVMAWMAMTVSMGG